MPHHGVIAFCTFYSPDIDSKTYKTKPHDRFNRYFKDASVLTQLRFKLKPDVDITATELTQSFNVTLYPSSLQSGSRSRVNLWSDMFRELSADLPPNLKSLNLRRLKQADTENLNISSLFVKFDEQPSKEVAVSKKSLEQLAEATTVDWPVIRSNNYSGEDSENEDEDDDGYGDGNDDLI